MQVKLENIGPIRSADLKLADLTVFVGPQASGKSIALQLLKLLIDAQHVKGALLKDGFDWDRKIPHFLDLYFGKGMREIWTSQSCIFKDNAVERMDTLITEYGTPGAEKVFFAPAQRVITFREGWPRNFSDYQVGDPFVMRSFSENLRVMCDRMLCGSNLNPLWQELGEAGRLLKNEVFAGYDLHLAREDLKRKFVLRHSQTDEGLTHMAWSTGQREFIPLLLAFQKILCPVASSKNQKRQSFDWVVLEEIEMGLHPRGITAALLPVFSLLNAGKKVCLSTHSSQILDVLWALKLFREKKVDPDRVLDIFQLPKTEETRQWASGVLGKSRKVYYFDRNDGIVKDISDLDPGAEENGQSGWGGLTEFEGRVGNIVAEVMA